MNVKTNNIKITNIDTLQPYISKGYRIGKGTTAVCYKMGDKLLKKYIPTTGTKNMFCYIDDMVEQLKILNEIQNDTYIGPEEVLVKDGVVVAYIYPYIEGPTFRYISSRTRMSDLYTNYDKLINDTLKVSECGFKLCDLHDKNIIFNNNTYYVIDLDKGHLIEGSDNPVKSAKIANIRSVNDTIIYSMFRTYPWFILTFGDERIQKAFYQTDWTKDENIYEFFRLLGEKCKDPNPTLHKVRRKVKVYKELNSYYHFF